MLSKFKVKAFLTKAKEKSNNIMKYNVVIFIILLTILKPFNVTMWPTIDVIFKLLKFLCALFLFIAELLNGKINKFLIVTILFVSECLFSTVIYHGDFSDVQSWLSIVMIGLLFKLAAQNKGLYHLAGIINAIFSAWIVLNTISVFIGGPLFAKTPYNYPSYFLGCDNYFDFINIVLIGIISAIDKFYNRKFSKSTFILWGFVILSEAYTFTVGGLIALIFMMVLLFIMDKVNFKKIINIQNIIIMQILLVISISYLHIENIFNFILVRLGKGTNFSYRGIIWPRAISLFLKNLFLGYGLQNEKVYKYYLAGADHCHNIVLQILVTGGIIGGVLFALLVYYAAQKLKEPQKGSYLIVLFITVCAYLINSFFDFYTSLIYLYVLLNFIYYINEFSAQSGEFSFDGPYLKIKSCMIWKNLQQHVKHITGKIRNLIDR